MYRKTRLDDDEKRLLSRFDEIWPGYMKKVQKALALSQAGNRKEAENLIVGDIRHEFQTLDEILSDLVTVNKEAGKQAYEASNQIYARHRVYFITLVLVCVGVTLGDRNLRLPGDHGGIRGPEVISGIFDPSPFPGGTLIS